MDIEPRYEPRLSDERLKDIIEWPGYKRSKTESFEMAEEIIARRNADRVYLGHLPGCQFGKDRCSECTCGFSDLPDWLKVGST